MQPLFCRLSAAARDALMISPAKGRRPHVTEAQRRMVTIEE